LKAIYYVQQIPVAGFVLLLTALPLLVAAEEEPVRVFRQVSRSVVELSSVSGHGTGILLNSSGLVLMNAHVVVSPVPFRGRLDVEKGGKWETDEFPNVRILAMHPEKDMALVQLNMSAHPGVKVSPASISIAKVSPGQSVYAIGNPGAGCMNLTKTITSGLLSGVDREIDKVRYYQIRAPINPGNSGGPLTDRNGNVLGMVTLKFQGSENVGFAIPLHDLDLSEFGPPNRRPINKARVAELLNVSNSLIKKYAEFEKRKQTELPQAKLLQYLLVQTYHEAMLNDPADARLHYLVGLMLTNSKSPEQAEAFLLQSLELNPWIENGAAYRWRGLIQTRQKKDVDAEAVWKEDVAKFPMIAGQIWEDLSILYREREDWKESKRCAARALFLHHMKRPEIRPDFAKSLIVLCRSKMPASESAAFQLELREIPKKLTATATIAARHQKGATPIITPAFQEWLDPRNRTLGRDRQADQPKTPTLTNSLLPPFVEPGTQVATSPTAVTTNSTPPTTTPAKTSPPASASKPSESATDSSGQLIKLIDVNRHAVKGE
jgi:hypothetical protein